MQLSIGQGMEIQHCLSRGEWTPEYLKQACSGELLSHQVLDVLRGDAEIVPVTRVIDGDAITTPDWEAYEFRRFTNPEFVRHTGFGVHKWDDLRFEPFKPTPPRSLWPKEICGMWESMIAFDEEQLLPNYLIGKRLGNLTLRDYLMRYPHLIPSDWLKTTRPDHPTSPFTPLLFWGTLIRNGDEDNRHTLVPGMAYDGRRWRTYDCVMYKDAKGLEQLFSVLVET